MPSFIFTESQLKNIKKSLTEQFDKNEKYKNKCNVEFYYHNVTFKGIEIDEITSQKINITYDIDMGYSNRGIEDAFPYNLQGPSNLEITIYYYEGENEEITSETVIIPIDWENIKEEYDETLGHIGYGEDIEINLKNNEQGNIVPDYITINKKHI